MSELEKAREEAARESSPRWVRQMEALIDAKVNAILDAREAKAPLEERIRALELIAFPAMREAKAPAPDDGGGVAGQYQRISRSESELTSQLFADIATAHARISELERERDEARKDQDFWYRNVCVRNLELRKAEAALAELRGWAEKAAEELMHISARTGSIPMPEVRHYVLSALTTLAPDHPLLATDPPPPTGDEPATTVTESCGCVFCDMGLEPSRCGDEMVHYSKDANAPWVICENRHDQPAGIGGDHV